MIDVGLVGFGLAGRCFHAPVIQAVPGLRLAAIVQRSGDSAARMFPDVPTVRNIDELLAIGSIRLVVIATPNETHFPLAQQCLRAGRDVVIDKPFTTTVAEGVELLRLANELRRLLTVYHNRRFDADFQALQKAAADGELGRIIRFESTYDRFRPTAKPGAWREKPGPGSGVLFDLAPHLIDQALCLLGKPEAVSADVRIEREGFATDDAFDLMFRYPHGARALLRATMLALAPRPRLVALGTKGAFLKQDFDPLENSLRNGEVPRGESWVVEREERWAELAQNENGTTRQRKLPPKGDWREFYANVRDAVLGKAPLLVTPQQALDVMVALDLVFESSNKGCAVAWRDVRG
jgi:scyllo-inositol 2-dehydrogenase (NADP+)